MNGKQLARHAILSLLILALSVSVGDACPTCRDAVTEGAHQAGIIRGYFWSILFMMSMPFLIFGSLATYFYLQIRRARLLQQSTGAEGSWEPEADRSCDAIYAERR